MKEILKNRKGFTLVELLAVIVVLAIIILVAMPNVLSAMDKARRNTFVTEANEFAKIAQTAYAETVLNGQTTGDATKGYCYSMKGLISHGFMDKKTGTYDAGSVLLQVDTNGKATYTIWMSNATYKVSNTKLEEITAIGLATTNSTKAAENCGGGEGITQVYSN